MCDDLECREDCGCWERGYEDAETMLQDRISKLEEKIEELEQKLDDIKDSAAH